MSLAARVALQKSEGALVRLVEDLRGRVEAGDLTAGPVLCQAVLALSEIQRATAPEASGRLLTTAELADKIGVSPKTLLKRKAKGEIRPLLQKGKLIRWAAGQTL
jgi:hypothetical protein